MKKQQATVRKRKYHHNQVEFSPPLFKTTTKVRFFVMRKTLSLFV